MALPFCLPPLALPSALPFCLLLLLFLLLALVLPLDLLFALAIAIAFAMMKQECGLLRQPKLKMKWLHVCDMTNEGNACAISHTIDQGCGREGVEAGGWWQEARGPWSDSNEGEGGVGWWASVQCQGMSHSPSVRCRSYHDTTCDNQ